jgi:TonB family protein
MKTKLYIISSIIATIMIMSYSCTENAKSVTDPMEEIIPPPPPPPPPDAPVPPAYTVENGDTTWIEVDEMPEFSGGELALLNFIRDAAKYPSSAKDKGIQGRVIVSFIVNEEGKVSKARIVEGVDPEIDAEALRVINSLPSFETPGIKDGKSVPVYCKMPITFKLK